MQPVTNQELDQFYGTEVSQYERNQAIANAKRGYDADDLSETVFANSVAILAALEDGDEMEVGRIFQAVRKATIARIASRDAYGYNQPNVITAGQV